MDIKDLSAEDQALLNTDFGDLEKEAAEQVKVASAMHELGEGYAVELADNMDKQAAEEKEMKEKMDKMDEDAEKKAMDLSAFIERGFSEKLASAGLEMTGDAMTFFRPFIVEKLASGGASEETIKMAMEMKEEKEEEKEDSKKEASAGISSEDQALLDTDFGELEKEAAEQLKLAQEMYQMGAAHAENVIASLVKEAEDCDDDDDKEDSKKEASAEMSEENVKLATDLSAFVERGFSEKLASLGEERHGDALAYFEPFIMEKVAKGKPEEGHHVRRAVIGTPLSAAIEAKKGKKGRAFSEALKNQFGEMADGGKKGLRVGARVGAGVGAVGGAVDGASKAKGGGKAKLLSGLAGAGRGAVAGGLTGSLLGGYTGAMLKGFKANHGEKASKIHGKYSKNKK